MSPLITVIVPVYNVEKYINTCIDSLIKQTYKNLEIILVDDGSPDNCPKICDNYAVKDKRIQVIHKKNGGLSDARNVATKIATGEYITFVDSDDYVAEDYIEYLYLLLKKHQAEISVCAFSSFSETKLLNIKNNKLTEQCFNPSDALKAMFYQKLYEVAAWGKLYKKELAQNNPFPKGKLFEDLQTVPVMFTQATCIAYGNKKQYFYRYNSESIMNSEFKVKRLELIEITDTICKFIANLYPEVNNALLAKKFSNYSQTLKFIPNEDKYVDIQKKLFLEIKKIRFEILTDKNVRFKNKIAAILSYLGKKIYIKILKFI